MNNKGQSIFSEHAMIFFVVIAALVAMTTFVQRGFEARVHDARNFAVDSVSKVCDADCQLATGKIAHEYEPYYSQMVSDQQHNEIVNDGATSGSAQSIGAIYYKSLNENTKTISTSNQLPPECADAANPKLPECGGIVTTGDALFAGGHKPPASAE